jgi:hypothetical protein
LSEQALRHLRPVRSTFFLQELDAAALSRESLTFTSEIV